MRKTKHKRNKIINKIKVVKIMKNNNNTHKQ